MRIFHGLTVALVGALVLLATPGCGDVPVPPESGGCSDEGPPGFLQSKIDDDDGDGLILDEDFPTINDEDDDIADHAWVRDAGGVYHLFFHTEGLYAGSTIEHYTSIDLRRLHYVGTALTPVAGSWDSDDVWAPHVIGVDDSWYMFYTGVEGEGPTARQRIGVAVSADLAMWTRLPMNTCPGTTGDGCVYECDETWTVWSGPNDSHNQQCRDPFVIRDTVNGRWVLFATAKSTNQFGVVTVAFSDNLSDWSGAGFIDATRRLAVGAEAQTTGGQAENPFVMTHGNTYYLLFTDWQDQEDSLAVADPRTMTQYATSTSLSVDTLGSAGWTYRGYTPDPGVNASEVQHIHSSLWVMSQSISNKSSGDLEEHRRQLRLKCITFGPGLEFDTSNFVFPDAAGRGTATPFRVDSGEGR